MRIEGEVERARELGFEALREFPQVDVGAKIAGKEGAGVMLRSLLDAAGASPEAKWATLASDDGAFAISVPLAAIADNALIAYRVGDAPLPAAKGGPMRFYVVDAAACGTADVDACANVKRLGTIRLTRAREADVGHDHAKK